MYKYLILNHIPRCGGSSIRKSIYNAIKTNNHFSQAPYYISEFSHANICLYDQPHLIEAIHPETLLFIDHSPSFFLEDIFKIPIDQTYRILTLREPLSRIVSHIHYFYNRHIDTLSEIILKNYLEKFGHMTIWYLTQHKHSNESLTKKYKIAKKTIKDYQFYFKVEDQKLCELFNDTNPFQLHIPNYHINHSPVDSSLPISQPIKNFIYKHIPLEIKLLEAYYEMEF